MFCDDSILGMRLAPQGEGGAIPTSSLQFLTRPFSLRYANDFVEKHHRHNGRTSRDGGKFALAAWYDGEVVGVAIVGNPISATYMNIGKYGYVAEIVRVCTKEGAPKNTVSFLYASCARVCREMGYDLLVSYTLKEESGASLKGAGWVNAAGTKAQKPGWGKKDHLVRHFQKIMGKEKFRWEYRLRQHGAKP